MPNRSASSSTLAHRLQRTVFRLGRGLRAANEGAPVSVADLLLLSAIRLQPGSGVSELARSQGVGRSVVSEQATRLESAGLVRRDPCEGDARRVGLSLTDAGITAFGAAAQRREAWLALRLNSLSASEQDVLSTAVALLDRLADAGSNIKQQQRERRHG